MDWSIDSIGFYVVWAIMVVHEQYFSLYIIFTSNQTKSKIISLFLFILFFSLFTLFCWVFLVFYYNIKGETGNVATFRLLRLNAKIKKNKQTNKQKYLWKTWFKKKTQYPTPKKNCSSETRTRDLWNSKPVRYPLGQYVLELKKAYFL